MKKVPGLCAEPLRRFTTALVSMSSLLFACGSIVGSVHAEPMVDFIVQQFQEQCDAEQADFRGIDDDLDAPLQGVLTLSAVASVKVV